MPLRKFMFLSPIALFWLILLLPTSLGHPVLHVDRLIVWNVGQGSWITVALKDRCHHFDMGGETAPLAAVKALCGAKENSVFFSHWDWDHIGFAKAARKILPNLCVAAMPGGPGSPKKRGILRKLPPCSSQSESHAASEVAYTAKRSTLKKLHTANAYSRVFTWDQSFLISGDSPIAAEEIWLKNLISTRTAARIKWFILGHHGSHTSNSPELLARLTNLKGSVASARRRRYGHPHPKVLRLLRERKIPLIVTEDWGHLHFVLDRKKRE